MSSSIPEKQDPTVVQKTELDEKASISPSVEVSQTSNLQWLQMGEQTSKFIKELIGSVAVFFDAYKLPLVVLGVVLLFFITLKIAVTLLDAINAIPLVKPLFELIGLGYTGWFVYRYLISASKRSELTSELGRWRDYFLGQTNLNR